MLEQLRVILEAEAAARRRIEAAMQEARLCTSQAEEEGRAAVRRAQLGRDAVVRAAEEEQVRAAMEKARDLREQARASIAVMRVRAETQMARAIDAIVACVLGEDETGDA